MYTVLSITIPFFSIIFLGTFFRYKRIFDENSSKILTKFALYVTLPPFIFVNIIKSSNNTLFNWNFILRYELITLFILVTSFYISKIFLKNNKRESSLFSLNSAYPNYGYMGIPLSILAFGDIAAIPISLILLLDSIVLLSFTSFFTSNHNDSKLISKLYYILLDMIKNPILASVFIGFIFIIFEIKLNIMIFKFINILSLAATPTALFALGITLCNNIKFDSIKQTLIISIFKLLLHPLLIFLIFYYSPTSIDTIWIKVAVLCSCLPVASNVFAMSIYYNSFIKITSSSILVTTILSTFTTPIILFYLL